MDVLQKIDSRKLSIGIIGMGYVGLPLSIEFARSGFKITGFEIDKPKVTKINRGSSYIGDVDSTLLKRYVQSKNISATTDFSKLSECDAAIICVPTPLRKTRDPDISFIVNSVEQIVKHGKNMKVVVLESTTYPGTCEEVILPMLSSGGRHAGKDFFLAFSPERVDPGNEQYPTRKIPKVIGGITAECTRVVNYLYEKAIDKTVPVSSTRVAEMIKLLENTFRSVNIGLINETALMCHAMGIDVWEVIRGAATKPFAFMPFYPGPGLGGHCIPIDPLYLSWKAKMSKFNPKFIELASEINESMPGHVVQRTMDLLNTKAKSLKNSKVLILGVAYKPDVSDTRESPAIEIIEKLTGKGARVSYSDPYVPEFKHEHFELNSVELTEQILKKVDIALIITHHSDFDYDLIVKNAPLIFDSRNATAACKGKRKKVVTL
jgi:UDP-N-acetyl-D-glucosamine dehydrogenase